MRRLWWLGAGYFAGLATAAWIRGKVRRAAERYTPEHVRGAVAGRARDLTDRARQSAESGSRRAAGEVRRVAGDIAAAAAEGRAAMRRTETELRGRGPATGGEEQP